MVKGTKRKIDATKKITKSEYRATCFSKRSSGLYSKASQLCLLSGAQMAILATPSSSPSNVSFYSFGHSSVDSVVSAFLTGERLVPAPISSDDKQMREDIAICSTRNDLGLGFWWGDESLHGSKNPEEIKVALESMSSLMTKLRSMKEGHLKKKKETKKKKKKDVALYHETQQSLDQTLNPQPISTVSSGADDDDCLKTFLDNDDASENFKWFNSEEDDQFMENMDYEDSSKGTEIVALDDDSPENFKGDDNQFQENVVINFKDMDVDECLQIIDFHINEKNKEEQEHFLKTLFD